MGVALAVAFTVGMLVSPGVWSAVSARTTGAVNTSVKDAKCKVGIGPQDPAYDPVNHEIYVPNAGSSNISVVKAPCTKAGNIKLPASSSGTYPVAAAFDPAHDYVYVADADANAAYVINGTKIVTTLQGFDHPDALVYDPCAGSMMVANFGADNLSGINEFDGVFGNIPTGMGPDGIDYDPLYVEELHVANYYSGNVTTIYACSLANFESVRVGSNPEGIAYDAEGRLDYVADFGSDNVTDLFADSISGFDEPSSVTYAQAKLALYVTNYGSGQLWVLSTPPGSAPTVVEKITVAKGIFGSAYDDADDDIYVTDSLTGILYDYSA
ncbi:MAG: YncE family protein [Thermoplasmata archaeon]